MVLLKERLNGKMSTSWVRHWKGEVVNANTGADKTIHSIVRAPVETFTHIRVLLKNNYTEGSIPTCTGVLLAVSNRASTTAEKIIPSVGNTISDAGTSTDYLNGWIQVTFNGSTTPTLPAKGSGTNDAAHLWSDWMTLYSQSPVDDPSSKPYVLARCHFDTASHTVLDHGTGVRSLDKSRESYIESFIADGDFVTTPEDMVTGTATRYSNIHGFEFRSDRRSIKYLFTGDSITQGQCGSSGIFDNAYGWVEYAQEAFIAKGLPINSINYGFAAGDTTLSQLTALRAIDTHSPDVIVHSLYSPFGSLTQTIADIFYRKAMDVCEYATRNGVLPVISYLAPQQNATEQYDVVRRRLIQKTKDSGLLVCDMTPAVSTPNSTPVTWLTGTTDDQIHPNRTGYRAMARIWEETATAILVAKGIEW